jgi:hypothetical protein
MLTFWPHIALVQVATKKMPENRHSKYSRESAVNLLHTLPSNIIVFEKKIFSQDVCIFSSCITVPNLNVPLK